MKGFLVRKADFMTPRQRQRALQSLQWFLQGDSWVEIHKKGGYSWPIFAQMMVQFPDLSKAFTEARRQSGQSFEDKALTLADKLAGPNEYTGTGVRAKEVAMSQYRWSASRRNPVEFAEAGAKQFSVVVPIQINSSLNLAEPGAKDEEQEASIWEVHAAVLERATEAPPEADDELEVESEGEQAQSLSAGLPVAAADPLEALATAIGLPDEVPTSAKKRPSPGRPRKGHKTKQQTSATATSYARMHKSATVKAALKIKDLIDEPIEHVGDQSTGPRVRGE